VSVSITSDAFDDIAIDQANFAVLQQRTLGGGADVTVSAQGTGTAVMNLAVHYNTAEDPVPPFYEVLTSFLTAGGSQMLAQTCVRQLETSGDLGMVLVNVGLFTGYKAVPKSLDRMVRASEGVLKLVEQPSDREVALYFSEVTMDEVCVEFLVQRAFEVENLQPAATTVFAYYQPRMKGTHATKMSETVVVEELPETPGTPAPGSRPDGPSSDPDGPDYGEPDGGDGDDAESSAFSLTGFNPVLLLTVGLAASSLALAL